MTWVAPEVVRPSGALDDGERELLAGLLSWHRHTLLIKCSGLTGEDLARRSAEPSTLSLLGLLRHLAKVERIWFRERLAGEDVAPLHGGAGDPSDFDAFDPASAEAAWTGLVDEWAACDAVAAAHQLDDAFDLQGQPACLRFIYLHLIGEYARHNGHADLLRERLDGTTGA